jgi:hypothetical protein
VSGRFWLVAAVLLGGCHLVGATGGLFIEEQPADDTGGGAAGLGGGGGATTTTTTSTGAGGTGGAMFECTDAEQCPIPEHTCLLPKCTEGDCGVTPAPAGGACSENEGRVCDGDGHCVGCLVAADCEGGACVDQTCADPSCEDLTLGNEETDVDCGGICPPCEHDKACIAPSDCKSTICTGSVCVACTSHGQCDSDDYCEKNSTGYCVPKKGAWDDCDEGAECKTGICWFSSCVF